MSLPTGFSVQQGVANGATPLTQADKYNIGLMCERNRGVLNVPTMVGTLQDDRKRFGGSVASRGQVGAIVARNIFNNAGTYGATVYNLRLGGASMAAATVDITDINIQTTSVTFTTLVAAASGVYEKKSARPVNVVKGATFPLVMTDAGKTGTPWTFSYVATVATPDNVVKGWIALLAADATFADYYTWAQVGDALVITARTANDTFALTCTVTQYGTSPVTIATVTAGQLGEDDPGDWANNDLQVIAYAYGTVVSGKFLLDVYYKGLLVESFSNATIVGLYAAINAQSYYIHIEAVTAGAWVSAQTTIPTFTMAGGVYDAPAGESDYYATYDGSGNAEGLALFDGISVQLITTPDFTTTTMAINARNYCYGRGDCMFIANLAQFATDSTVAAYGSAVQTGDVIGSYVSAYNGWIQCDDENGGLIWVPCVGAVLGAGYLRVPQMQGDKIWFAPGGVDSVLIDCFAATPNTLNQSQIDSYVKTSTVNVLQFKQGVGTYILTSRSMSTNDLYHSVHIRRMTNWLLTTLKLSFAWVLQKPNTPELRSSIKVSLITFFKGLYDDGGLEKTVPFNTACVVICDVTNNPVSNPRSQLVCDIDWIPVECVEAFRINLNRNDGVLLATAAA